MRKLLLASTILAALAVPASADAVNNLSIGVLNSAVPQSSSNPCVICATQAQQPTINGTVFGFNNFDSQGNDSSFNLFSSSLTGSFGDGIQGTPYTAGFLDDALAQLGLGLTLSFGVAIDVNTAHGGETLQTFQLIDLSKPAGQRVIFDLSSPVPLPDVRNGNGFGDYLITGFDLSGIDRGDLLLFRASWSGASDGGESFYLVPIVNNNPVPGPLAGAGIPGLIAACIGLFALRRRRQ